MNVMLKNCKQNERITDSLNDKQIDISFVKKGFRYLIQIYINIIYSVLK